MLSPGNLSGAPEVDLEIWPHWPAGSLPYSLSVNSVSLYRFQLKRYLQLGPEWYRMFWDTERKWSANNRFAGQQCCPGHFFSLDPAGALAELNAYSAASKNYEEYAQEYALLRFDMSLNNVLDLTDWYCLPWFYKKHFSGEVHSMHWAELLDALLEQQLGGDSHNDFAGHRALLDGYNGIAFFGARSLGSHWPNPGSGEFARGGSLGSRDLDLIGLNYAEMRDDPKCINVVLYFGHNVVRATRQISFEKIVVENRLFQAPYPEIDSLFLNDPDRPADEDLTYENLRHRVERTVWPRTPGFGYERLVSKARSRFGLRATLVRVKLQKRNGPGALYDRPRHSPETLDPRETQRLHPCSIAKFNV
jgi:hypothetical protein